MANVTTQTIEYVAKTNNATRGLKALSREQKNLIDEFRTGNRTYDETRNSLKQIARGYEDAEQGAKSYRSAIKALRNEQRLSNQTQVNEDRFDTTSRRVALAGDVQSNLGALSGLAGAAGAGGAAQGIGLAGELVVLTEELPRLKEAVRGLPTAANAAGQALGLGGGAGLVGAMAATAVAVGVVAFAFKQFQGQFKDLKSIVDGQIAGIRAANDFVIGQAATTEQITARIADLNREAEATATSLDRFKSALEEIQSGQSALSDEAILGALGFGGIKELKDAIADLEGESVGAGQEIRELENFLGSARVSAADAAAQAKEAEDALAQSREEAGQAILAEAAFAGELVALQQESAKFNEEELATKRLSIEQTIAQTKAELQLLEARNNGSEAIANQIEALKSELGQLDESLALLDSAQVKSAAASNSAKEAEEELRKEREKAAKSTRASATTEKRSGGGFRLPGTGRARTATQAAASQVESGITDAYREASEERLRLIKDYNQQETEIKRDAIFDQKQDLERFYFDQEQLINQGSFTNAFRSAVEKNFQQGQDRDRLQFDADNRRNDLTAQIQQLAQSLQQQTVQLQIQPSREFNVRVTGGTAGVITRIGSY